MTSTESTATDTTELSAISANSADSDAAADAIALDFKLARLVAAWKVDASTVDISERVTARIQLKSTNSSAALNTQTPLTPEQEEALFLKVEKGDKEAHAALIDANLHLVQSTLKALQEQGSFTESAKILNLTYEDLIQEGKRGLSEGILKFNYRRGVLLSEHAFMWIMDAIGEALEKAGRAEITEDDTRRTNSSDPEPSKTALLSAEQEKALAIRIEQGDKSAREALVNANLRLVTAIAKKYQNRGVAMEDLIQEGTLGLIHAVDKFDHWCGFRFSTYATHWIRQALGHVVENPGQTVRLPAHAIEALAKIKSTRDLLAAKLNRTPTVNEIALEAGLPIDRVKLLLQADTAAEDSLSRLGDLLPAKDAQPFERIPVGSSAHALAQILYVSQSASPVPTDSLLKQKYWLGVSDTERFQKARHGTFPYIDLVTHPPSVDVQIVISPELANRYGIVPVRKQDNRLWVACLAPDDVHAIDAVRMYTKCLVQPMIADPGAIADALVKYYGSPNSALVPPPPPSQPPVSIAAGTPEPSDDTATLLRSAISELRGLREEVLTLRSEVAALQQERSATVPRPSTARLFPFAPPESASLYDR